jgi:hypothetical protein
MTYQPRTEAGMQGLQSLSNFMAPVGQAFEGASSFLGDAAFDATGSPALGAAAYSMPTVGLEALGLKAARAIPGRQFEVGDIGRGGILGKQRGSVAPIKPSEGTTMKAPPKKDAFTITPEQAVADGYDLDNVFYAGTNGSPAEGIVPLNDMLPSGGENFFGGIFASSDESIAASHGSNIQRLVAKKGIAVSDDLDVSADTDAILKSHWRLDDLSPDEFDELRDSVTQGRSLFDSDVPEDRLIEIFGGEDIGEADFRAQGLRGMLAKKLGFDAVEMPDEHGTSYLFVGDGVRRVEPSN